MPFTPIPRTEPIRHDTEDMQTLHPQLITLADGRRLMVFEGRSVEDDVPVYRYYGQHLDTDSQPQDAPFVLGDYVMGRAGRFDLAALEDGGFALAWGPREGVLDHFVRSFDADGTPRSAPVALDALGEGWTAGWVNVDPLPGGGFAVTWAGQLGGGFGQDTRTGIFNQRFDDTGGSPSTPMPVSDLNTLSAFGNIGGRTGSPAATVLEDGSAVIVWQSFRALVEDSHNALFGRMLDAEGRPAGDTFRIADFADRTVTTAKGHEVLALSDGGFAVLWNDPVNFETTTPGGDPTVIGGWAVTVQRYDADGQAVGGPRALSQPTEPYAREPSALVQPDGDIALVWDTAREGLPVARGDAASWFQRLDGDFNPLAPPVRIEAGEAIGDRVAPGTLTLDTDADGAVTLAWHSLTGAGQFGAFTQTLLPQIFGTDGDDALMALDVGTMVFGLDGDDRLVSGPGDDWLDGGAGSDTAVFSGALSDYALRMGADGVVTATDLRAPDAAEGHDGTDRLVNIEQAEFADETAPLADIVLRDIAVSVQGVDGSALASVSLGFTDAAGASVAVDPAGFSLMARDAGVLEGIRDHDPTVDGRPTAMDALEVLRMAVGLNPSFGPAQAQNFIAADMNGDGVITALDALEVLRAAVGLASDNAPRWVFVDATTDWEALEISRSTVQFETGIRIEAHSGDLDLGLTGILLGNMTEVV